MRANSPKQRCPAQRYVVLCYCVFFFFNCLCCFLLLCFLLSALSSITEISKRCGQVFLITDSSDSRVVKSVCPCGCRLGFDAKSGQTSDFEIGIHSYSLHTQH